MASVIFSAVRFSAGGLTILQWKKYVKSKTVMLISNCYCTNTPNLIMASWRIME